MTPGWVTTHRFARSISTIRSIAVKAIVSAPSMPGRAAATARSRRRAARSGRRCSAADPHRARRPRPSRSGGPRRPAARPAGTAVSSRRYVSRSVASVSRRRPGSRARIGVEERSVTMPVAMAGSVGGATAAASRLRAGTMARCRPRVSRAAHRARRPDRVAVAPALVPALGRARRRRPRGASPAPTPVGVRRRSSPGTRQPDERAT